MTHRLVAVDDADYRLPEPVFAVIRQSIQASTGLNALDYGAIRNGVADDTAALQAAADAAATGGMRLIIPPGVYKTTATLNISSGVEGFDAADELKTRKDLPHKKVGRPKKSS